MRYTKLDCVGVKTPTISEMDFSSASHSFRVISELVITAARNTAARTRRRMSFVRRVSGCSKLPETVMSRPSTRMSPASLHVAKVGWVIAATCERSACCVDGDQLAQRTTGGLPHGQQCEQRDDRRGDHVIGRRDLVAGARDQPCGH